MKSNNQNNTNNAANTALENKDEVISKDFINDEQGVENGEKVRHKYIINSAGKEKMFVVSVITRTTQYSTTKLFQVKLAENVQVEYIVDEGNKALVNTLKKDEKLNGKLFEGVSENGYPFLGLDVRTSDGYRIQYSRRERGKVADGFWFSSGDRQALKRLGFLDLVKVGA